MKRISKMLSLLLALTMILTFMPALAFAEDETTSTNTMTETEVSQNEDTESQDSLVGEKSTVKTLDIENGGEESGGESTATYTVTWKNGSTTLETDTDVASGAKPSYDGAEPTKEATEQYTYTFAGWATEDNQESGTAASDLPEVTDNKIYYAAFKATQNVASITNDSGTQYYISILDAWYALKNGETIKIEKDTSFPDKNWPITDNMTLDLNGHNVLSDKVTTISGDFTIEDSSDEKKGILNISQDYGLRIGGTGKLTVKSGTISMNGSNFGLALFANTRLLVNGGTIKGKNVAVWAYEDNVSIELKNGSIISDGDAAIFTQKNKSGISIIVNGGRVEANTNTIEVGSGNKNCSVNIAGGSLIANSGGTIANNAAGTEINIKGGSLYANGNVIADIAGANITIDGSNTELARKDKHLEMLYSCGNLSISGGSFTGRFNYSGAKKAEISGGYFIKDEVASTYLSLFCS